MLDSLPEIAGSKMSECPKATATTIGNAATHAFSRTVVPDKTDSIAGIDSKVKVGK